MMKTYVYAILLVISAWGFQSCDNDDDFIVEPTPTMREFINVRYSSAQIVKTEREDDGNDPYYGYTEVEVLHNGILKEVIFDKKDAWVCTKWDVPVQSLSDAIKNDVATKHPEYRIDDADYYEMENEMYYLLELEAVGKPELHVKIKA